MPAELKPGRGDSEAFRAGLALSLRERGIPASSARTADVRRLEPVENMEHGDLWGVPDWALITRTESRRQLAPAVRQAEAACRADSKTYAAAVWRSTPTLGGGLVVLSWANFVHLVADKFNRVAEESDDGS